MNAAPSPQTIAETYPAIPVALGLLNDHHSYFQKADGASIYNPNPLGACGDPAVTSPQVPSDIGYVRVGTFSGSGAAAVDFAVSIQQQIAARDNAALVGWIVDLRGNGGGNMWPMVAGLGPILGDGTAGAFIDPDGVVTYWAYSNGASTSGGFAYAVVPNAYTLQKPSPRVAVLTDCRAASSGEASIISFRGRTNTRSFGTPSRGLSTANAGFPMSDGAILILTTATMADRNLVRYGGPVVPDEVTGDAASTVERAVAWLRGY